MFIRKQRINGVDYFRVVQSFRDKSKVKSRTIVSLGQCATIEEAIQAEKVHVSFWEHQVEWGVKRNKKGRYLLVDNRMITAPVGETAKPRLARSLELLQTLEWCRDVMLKDVVRGNTI